MFKSKKDNISPITGKKDWHVISASYLDKVLWTQEDVLPVKVVLPFPRIVAKGIKYVMLAIITGCCIQSAFILTEIAKRLL